MAYIYAAVLRTARMQAVLDAINQDVGAGSLVIGTSALSGATGVLATVPFDDPAGSVAGDVLTFTGLPNSATASGTGTAAKAEIRDNSGDVIVSGLTVGLSAADVIINALAVSAGQTIQISAGSITHAT